MKIVAVVNKMISNGDEITNVVLGATKGDIYFIFAEKFRFSMHSVDDGYFLYLYPKTDLSSEELAQASMTVGYSQDIPAVAYSSSEINTREALRSFAELFQMLTEKVYGADKILDELLDDDVDFPF